MKKNRIGFVCMANFCRSPVAEVIFKNFLKESNIDFFSAGIQPIAETDMDIRSKTYLIDNGFKIYEAHIPKQINITMIKNSQVIYAMDHLILMILIKTFPTYSKIFKLINHNNKKMKIPDPYKMKDKEYIEVMNSIKKVSMNIISNF